MRLTGFRISEMDLSSLILIVSPSIRTRQWVVPTLCKSHCQSLEMFIVYTIKPSDLFIFPIQIEFLFSRGKKMVISNLHLELRRDQSLPISICYRRVLFPISLARSLPKTGHFGSPLSLYAAVLSQRTRRVSIDFQVLYTIFFVPFSIPLSCHFFFSISFSLIPYPSLPLPLGLFPYNAEQP